MFLLCNVATGKHCGVLPGLLQVADCQVKLQRADKLIGGLGGERTRWSATVQQLQSDLHNVVGDVMLAAGECVWR